MPEPIAIVGLGGVLPGAATLDDFWSVVEAGVDTASDPLGVPASSGTSNSTSRGSTFPQN